MARRDSDPTYNVAVAEKAPKRLLRWLGDRLGDKLLDRVIESAVTVGFLAVALTWLKKQWACIQQPQCGVPGWLYGTLIAVSLAATAIAICFARGWYRARHKLRTLDEAQPRTISAPAAPRFHAIEVEDKRLHLRWFIRRPPSEWLNWRDIARSVNWRAVQQVLDGPFHAFPECNAPLTEIPQSGALAELIEQSPYFDDRCGHCGERIFRTGGPLQLKVAVWQVRAQALEELQRMERNGTKLSEHEARQGIVLQNPGYWKSMLPPK